MASLSGSSLSGGGSSGGGGGGGAGSWTLVEEITASDSATVDFEGIDDTYDIYMVEYDTVIPATDATYLYLQVGTGPTPTYVSAGGSYKFNNEVMSSTNTTSYRVSSTSATEIRCMATSVGGFGTDTGETAHGSIIVYNPANATLFTVTKHFLSFISSSSSNICTGYGSGLYNSATAVTALRLYMSTGNITSGTFKLYGKAKS